MSDSNSKLLGITTLSNSMILFISMMLSTVSIRSRDFTLSFPERPHINRDVFFVVVGESHVS